MFDFVKRLFKRKSHVKLVEGYLHDIVLEEGIAKMITSYMNLTEEVLHFTKLANRIKFRYMNEFVCDINPNTGLSPFITGVIDLMLNHNTKYKLDVMDIYEIIIDVLIEKNRFNDIYWSVVGSGISNYTRLENLPTVFIRKFQNRIDWVDIGCCYSSCHTSIGDLPIEFVREFQDKIDWKTVNRAIWIGSCTNLSDGFVKEFGCGMSKKNWKLSMD